MSESRSRVTITLGRTGQVVKRAGSSLDDSVVEPNAVAGSKRSARERLGEDVDSSFQLKNKRLKGNGRNASAFDDIRLNKDDLRYKIMQKNKLKVGQNSQQSGVDLRNMLSRPSQSSINSVTTRDRIPLRKDARPHYVESMDARQHHTDPRDERHLIPAVRNSSQYIKKYQDLHAPDPRDQRISEARESGWMVSPAAGVRHHLTERNSYGIMAPVNTLRPTKSVTRMESERDSYSPWNLESLKRRSPDETLAIPRDLSVPSRIEELPRQFTVRANDDAKMSAYLNRDALEYSRPMSSSSYLTKMTPAGLMKNTAPLVSDPVPVPVRGSLSQKSSFVVDDNTSVDYFMRSLGLERYSILFKAEEVDMYSLKRMVDSDLKEIGIPMGPRKKILLALHPLPRRQA